MKRFVLLLVVFAVMACVALLAFTPFAVVTDRIGQRFPAVAITAPAGTIWNGQASDVRLGRQSLGTGRFQQSLIPLIGGTLDSRFALSGVSLVAQGQVRFSGSGSLQLSEFRATGQTSELVGLVEDIRDLDGRYAVDIARLIVSDGACVEADGRVWTDLLTNLDVRYQWAGPELEGPLSCENGDIRLSLSGTGDSGEAISVELVGRMDGRGSFNTRIRSAGPELRQAAILLGFQVQGDELSYVRTFD